MYAIFIHENQSGSNGLMTIRYTLYCWEPRLKKAQGISIWCSQVFGKLYWKPFDLMISYKRMITSIKVKIAHFTARKQIRVFLTLQ